MSNLKFFNICVFPCDALGAIWVQPVRTLCSYMRNPTSATLAEARIGSQPLWHNIVVMECTQKYGRTAKRVGVRLLYTGTLDLRSSALCAEARTPRTRLHHHGDSMEGGQDGEEDRSSGHATRRTLLPRKRNTLIWLHLS